MHSVWYSLYCSNHVLVFYINLLCYGRRSNGKSTLITLTGFTLDGSESLQEDIDKEHIARFHRGQPNEIGLIDKVDFIVCIIKDCVCLWRHEF